MRKAGSGGSGPGACHMSRCTEGWPGGVGAGRLAADKRNKGRVPLSQAVALGPIVIGRRYFSRVMLDRSGAAVVCDQRECACRS